MSAVTWNTCPGCGREFPTTDPRRTKCSKDCGRDRTAARTVRFAAVDGEGVTLPGGRHDYVELAVSDAVLTDGGHELDPYSILEFLWDQRGAGDALIGYYLGYDFTQWIKYLPEGVARALVTTEGIAARARTRSGGNPTPFPVRWEGWELDLLADRRFKLRPKGAKEWAYVCDAGPFWQCSFLRAIDPAGWSEPVCTDQEFSLIREGKARRGVAQLDAEMTAYNRTENLVLERLMGRLDSGLTAMGVQLDRDQWYGPGQAAGEWLAGVGAPDSAAVNEAVPAEVLDAARASYYGGWFEIFAHGPVGDLHEYDLNSAYPHAISQLPCWLHGRWERNTLDVWTCDWTLVHAEVTGANPIIGTMLHREPDGKIHRPARTRGWFWGFELDAALDAGLIEKVEDLESWTYRPCACPPPLRSIADLYEHRLAVGKDTVAGKAAKLVYNSVYGKKAQSIGRPRWANPLDASAITARTRARICQAVGLAGPSNVAMIATDGIYTFEPIQGLSLSETQLGAWSCGVKHGVTLHMPGVYWDDASRERLATGRGLKLASRGVSAAALGRAIGALDHEWSVWPGTQAPWPVVSVPIDFSMITARQALARGRWNLAGTVVEDDVKVLSGDPVTKRDQVWTDSAGRIRTMCYPHGTRTDSAPYDGRLGVPEDPQTPDGGFAMLFNDMLR